MGLACAPGVSAKLNELELQLFFFSQNDVTVLFKSQNLQHARNYIVCSLETLQHEILSINVKMCEGVCCFCKSFWGYANKTVKNRG